LGLAISKRPVFPGGFDEVYRQILRRQARRFCQNFSHALEEFSFLLRLAAKAHGDLNEDDAVGTMNTEVLRIVNERFWRIFSDDLEAVIRRNGDSFDHRPMNSIRKRLAIFRRSALAE
jgi:hypothetical protein